MTDPVSKTLRASARQIRAKADTPEQEFIRRARKIIWMLLPDSETSDEHTKETVRDAEKWMHDYFMVMKDRA